MSTLKSKSKSKSKNIRVITKPKDSKETKFMSRAAGEKTSSIDKLEQTKDYQSDVDEGEGDGEEDNFNIKRENKEENDEGEGDEEQEDRDDIDYDTKPEKEEREDKYDEEDCVYAFNKVNIDDDSEPDEDIDMTEEDTTAIDTSNRISKNVLTKYERVRALGARAKQISMGAKPMIKNTSGLSAKEIAKLELVNKVMPFIIERQLPNGRVERWNINELKIVN